LESPADRVFVVAALVVFPLAARSLRNVPTFMMIAAPAVSRLLHAHERRAQQTASSGPRPTRERPLVAVALVAAALVAGLGIVAIAWHQEWPRLGWQPIDRREAHAIAACPGPLYNDYASGGPIIWFVPSQPVFIDSRQDPYPIAFVQAATAVEASALPACCR
jgi:hypothetical protein